MGADEMSNSARDMLIFMAKLAEQAERFDDMADAMKQAVLVGPNLTLEERNLLSVAFKNLVGTRRSSWRSICSVEEKEEAAAGDFAAAMLSIAREFRKKIESEICKICADILVMLNDHLIPVAEGNQARVFYLKMKGDYNRYLAELYEGDEKKQVSDSAMQAYQKALEEATVSMTPVNPIRLGVALNYSVFQCEILNDLEKACDIANSAFNEAVAELDTVPDEDYKDATLIMQLIRDNLALWTMDQQPAAHAEPDEVVDDQDDGDFGEPPAAVAQ